MAASRLRNVSAIDGRVGADTPPILGNELGGSGAARNPWLAQTIALMPIVPSPVATLNSKRHRRCVSLAAMLAAAVALGGCGTSPTESGTLDKALELVGLRKPAAVPSIPKEVASDLLPRSRQVSLRLHASAVLNTDGNGRSLSVVARVYKLRSSASFLQLPHEAVAQAGTERGALLPQDVIEVREVVLAPGQRHEVIETMPPEATHLAVAALFRSPAPQRWRFVFDTRSAAASGVTLGLHGCAMSVAQGQAVDVLPETARLAGVQCQ